MYVEDIANRDDIDTANNDTASKDTASSYASDDTAGKATPLAIAVPSLRAIWG
jgi:hypothetical protein